jgi:hypothetical protein
MPSSRGRRAALAPSALGGGRGRGLLLSTLAVEEGDERWRDGEREREREREREGKEKRRDPVEAGLPS